VTRFILSPRAQADLSEIWDYTAKHWGVEQAQFYGRQIQTAIKNVAAEPGLGRACEAIRPGYKKFPGGSHVLFYRLAGSGIEVIRILHRHMDFDRLL
jgi:toxin ParE1/3/4